MVNTDYTKDELLKNIKITRNGATFATDIRIKSCNNLFGFSIADMEHKKVATSEILPRILEQSYRQIGALEEELSKFKSTIWYKIYKVITKGK